MDNKSPPVIFYSHTHCFDFNAKQTMGEAGVTAVNCPQILIARRLLPLRSIRRRPATELKYYPPIPEHPFHH
jgi:hypothetical protein